MAPVASANVVREKKKKKRFLLMFSYMGQDPIFPSFQVYADFVSILAKDCAMAHSRSKRSVVFMAIYMAYNINYVKLTKKKCFREDVEMKSKVSLRICEYFLETIEQNSGIMMAFQFLFFFLGVSLK